MLSNFERLIVHVYRMNLFRFFKNALRLKERKKKSVMPYAGGEKDLL